MFRYVYYKILVSFARLLQRLALGKMNPRQHDVVLRVASRQAGRTIKLHAYYPLHARPSTPSAVLLTAHRSGFIFKLHGQDDDYCRRAADAASLVVLDLQYRLAPEHPCPAAVEDVLDALKYIASAPDLYDQSRVSIGGFSAGGSITLAAACAAECPVAIRSAAWFYPCVTIAVDPSTKKAPQEGGHPFADRLARVFNQAYVAPPMPSSDPRVSPLLGNLARAPDTVSVVSCGYDNLAPEAEELAERLQKLGKTVKLMRVDKVDHAWDKSANTKDALAKVDAAYEQAFAVLRS